MTAPVAPIAPAAPSGNPVVASSTTSSELTQLQDRFTSDDFISEVVRGVEADAPDPNEMADLGKLSDSPTIGDFGDDRDEPAAPQAAPVKEVPRPSKVPTDGDATDTLAVKAEKKAGELAKAEAKVAEGAKAKALSAEGAEGGEGAEGAEPQTATPPAPVKLATEFTVHGPDGAELDVADVMRQMPTIKVTHKGEVKELPLDRVVRLAQSGFHNEKLYGDAQKALSEVGAVEHALAEANASIKKQNEFIGTLLADDATLQQVREQWSRFNSPEARAERAERQLADLRAQQSGQSAAQASTSFYENDVKAPLSTLLQQFPTLTPAEVIGQFNILTAQYGAQISPKDFAAIRSVIRDELPAWAASLHETRTTEKAALTKAREANTLLKQKLAQGARPVGRQATADEGRARPKAPTGSPTADTAIASLVDEALADVF